MKNFPQAASLQVGGGNGFIIEIIMISYGLNAYIDQVC